MQLGIIGIGRVGLITQVCFAEKGWTVWGMDKDEEKLKKLKNKTPHFYEPGLQEMIEKNFSRLNFTSQISEVLENADILFICVGTPSRNDGSADLSQVEEVARSIAMGINEYKLLVEKSTVPVRTAEWIQKTIRLYIKRDVPYDVASNPEFLREGKAIYDFMKPDRIVIGVDSPKAEEMLLSIYKDFDCPKVVTDIKTAEIIKHASNAFLAIKISFINMVSDLCDRVEANIDTVAQGMGLDSRIGSEFLKAGLGYGGSCFPKDVRAFRKIGEDENLNFSLLKSVEEINLSRVQIFLEKIKDALWVIKGKTFAVFGLSFKPDTDDIREAPSIRIIERLLEEGGKIKLYDPKAMDEFKKIYPPSPPEIVYVDSPYTCAQDANAILIITDWDEFKLLDLNKLKDNVATPIIIDGRNIYDRDKMSEMGFSYYTMGKPKCGF